MKHLRVNAHFLAEATTKAQVAELEITIGGPTN